MILDAEQARERARRSTPTSKLVEKLMHNILVQCNRGKFHLVYWPSENNYTVRHAAEALRRLGYKVIYNDEGEGVSLWIDWEK